MFRYARLSKVLWIREGCGFQVFPLKLYVSECPKSFWGKPVPCFANVPVSRKFIEKRERGDNIKIFRRKFLVSQCQKKSYRKPSVLCFEKIPVAETFMDKKGGGRKSRFSVDFFCLTVPNDFVGEPLCAMFQKSSGSE